MNASFCQVSLFLSIIIILFQCRSCFGSFSDLDDIYPKLYKATQRTAQSIAVPTCYQIILNQNNIQSEYISSKGLTGRVLPAGTFSSTVLALEYLYALGCPIPHVVETTFYVQSVELARVAYNKDYLITTNELILNFTYNVRVTLLVSMAFDKDYKLCGYEGQIRNAGLTFDSNGKAAHQATIGYICGITQRFCNGTLKQYESVDACTKYLTTKVPYGSIDRGDQGNVACRSIHAKLVPLIPSIHCPHVGPTGGDACTDKTIDFYYQQSDFLACAHKYH